MKSFWIITSLLVTFLMSFYIFQVNASTEATFQVKNYQEQLIQLKQDYKESEIVFSNVNSLDNVEDSVENLNFKKVDNIHYIKVIEPQVASK